MSSGCRQGALNPATAVRTHGQLSVGELLNLFSAASALFAFVLIKGHYRSFWREKLRFSQDTVSFVRLLRF
jgi:hypothetical protein